MPPPARLLTHAGQTLTLEQWAALRKITPNTIRARLDKLKWSVADALDTPADPRFRAGPKKRPLHTPRPCPPLKPHSSGQAVCRWYAFGREHARYFGRYGSKAAAAAYKRFQAEWAAGGGDDRPAPGETLFVAELAERFLAWVGTYYRKDGRPTSEVHGYRAAVAVLNELYGDRPAAEFEPDHLRAVAAALVQRRLARTTVNRYAWRCVKLFKWAAGRKLVPPAVPAALALVEREQAGRSAAPDRPKKRAVPPGDVAAVFAHLHKRADARAVLGAMVRVQLFTGMRPGEVCRLRAGDVERLGDLWRFEDRRHKTRHRGGRRVVWIGPRAQRVLAPLLAACPAGERVFRYPRWSADGPAKPVTVNGYALRVRAACERAGVPHWHPHQLRHSRASEVMRRYEDDEAVGKAIGDSPEVARQVYTDDPGEAVAKRIARETG